MAVGSSQDDAILPSAVIKHSYDARRMTEDNLARVSQLLVEHSIEFVVLPSISDLSPVLAVPPESGRTLLYALTTLDEGRGWQYDIKWAPVDGELTKAQSGDDEAREPFEILVFRRFSSPSGILLSTVYERILIQVWKRLGVTDARHDGGSHCDGTLMIRPKHKRGELEYLSPKLWREAQARSDHRIDLRSPLIRRVVEPVDMVYTWVDGSDPKWLFRKAQYTGDDPGLLDVEVGGDARYANNDELRYSLRSVEMYANWVRHIYIVTDNQIPNWLDTSHPKITIVDHRDIFSDRSVLPVFNANAIESQLHHIPGLSEHYVYMNDDFFFARPTGPDMFLLSNGLTKFFLSFRTLDIDETRPDDLPLVFSAKKGRNLLAAHHDLFATRKFKHTPRIQTRSVLERMEQEMPGEFAQTAASRFRHADDVMVTSLQHYYAYALGKAVPAQMGYRYIGLGSINASESLLKLSNLSLDAFCLNDTIDDDDVRSDIGQKVRLFLENKYPVPSCFETGLA